MIYIRMATPQDAPALPEIERSSGAIFRKWSGLEWVADDDVQSAHQHQALISAGIALVADLHGEDVVGFANGECAPDALHLWQVAVHHDYQGQGIGRQLIEAVQQLAARRRLPAVTLTTFREVPWNEPYYQRLGFKTLEAEALNRRLQATLEAEGRAGLPAERRCAMMLLL